MFRTGKDMLQLVAHRVLSPETPVMRSSLCAVHTNSVVVNHSMCRVSRVVGWKRIAGFVSLRRLAV